MANATISVVIPVLNGADMVGTAIRSAAAQSLRPLEIVVVDDGSSDGTPDELRRLQAELEIPLVVKRQSSGGEASARNSGVKLARGEYIAFLDHDDSWHSEKLATQAPAFERDPALSLSFTAYHRNAAEETTLVALEERSWEPHDILLGLMESCFITPSTVMVRRAALLEAGLFDEWLRLSPDWMMWLRLAARGHRIAYLHSPLTEYQWHGGNISRESRRIAETALVIFRHFFATEQLSPAIERRRRWCYARWHMVSAHTNLDAGRPRPAIAHLVRGTAERPLSVRPGWLLLMARAVRQAVV